MLSGESNAGDRRKTTIGLNSKKKKQQQLSTCSTLFFFFHFLAVVLHDYNAKRPETVFLWGKCRKCYRSLFFAAAHFHLTLVAASISHSVVPATKFSYWLPTKNVSFFLSLALDLCRPFSRWVLLACRLLSLFFCLSLALCSKFVDRTINLSTALKTTRRQKQFPLSVFVFITDLKFR